MTEVYKIIFTYNEKSNNIIREALITNNIWNLEDLEKLMMHEVFKINRIGWNRLVLIEQVMKHHKIKFKDQRWLNRKVFKVLHKIISNSPYYKESNV